MARRKRGDPVEVAPWKASLVPSRGLDRHGRPYWRARAYYDGREFTRGKRLGEATEGVTSWLRSLPRRPWEEEARKEDEHLVEVRTVRDLLDTWLPEVEETVKPTSYKAYTAAAQRVCNTIGDRPWGDLLTGIFKEHLRKSKGRIRSAEGQEGLAATYTLRNDWLVVRMAWDHHRGRRVVPNAELPKVRIPKGRVNPKHNPTAGEVAAVVRWLEETPRRRGRGRWRSKALRLVWYTGARPREVACIQVRDLALDASEVFIRESKTGPRWVSLPDEAVLLLQEMVPEDAASEDSIWPVSVETVRDLARYVRAACLDLKIPVFQVKGVRASTVDRLYRSNTDPTAAAAQLGHSAVTAFRHYREPTQADRAAAVKGARLGYLPRGEAVAFPSTPGGKDKGG